MVEKPLTCNDCGNFRRDGDASGTCLVESREDQKTKDVRELACAFFKLKAGGV